MILLNKAEAELLDVELTVPAGAPFELLLIKPDSGVAPILVDTENRVLSFDRTQFGETGFHGDFPGVHVSPLRVVDGKVTLRLLIDVASIEIFANDGESVISDLVFPKPGPWQFGFAYKGDGAPPKVERIAVFPLTSTWP
ncbi:MAG: GH32 C-terminal domain-containing protein [Verrucomicrobiales bacterium]